MSEADEYTYSLEEVAKALMSVQGIHKGIWAISVEYKFAAINAGPSQKEILPSAIIGLSGLRLNKAKKGEPLAFDAAILNPKTPAPKKAVPRSKVKKEIP